MALYYGQVWQLFCATGLWLANNLQFVLLLTLCTNGAVNPSAASFFPVVVTFVWGWLYTSPPLKYWQFMNMYFSFLIAIKFIFYLKVWCASKTEYELYSSDSPCVDTGITPEYEQVWFVCMCVSCSCIHNHAYAVRHAYHIPPPRTSCIHNHAYAVG